MAVSGGASRPKGKIDRTTLIIYIIISVIILAVCAITGAAMDQSVDANGKLNLAKMSAGFNYALTHPDLIFSNLTNKNSYEPKMVFFGAMVIGIYMLYKFSEDNKRLHRRGVEHGSAKWADKKEMKSLADPAKPVLKPILRYDAESPDGHRVYDKKGNFIGVMVDNNILLTKEVFLSLNSRQHLLNLNVLIIGGSGSGKTRFFAKPNIMQLNTSYVITDPKGEILQSTGTMLIEAGYKVRVFNTIEMQHSNNYNPFHYVYDAEGNLSEDNIKKMVDVLFQSTKGEGEKVDFWSQKGQTMLEAMVYLLFEESEYDAEYQKDEKGEYILDDYGHKKIIPETRDISHLNFYAVTEKMHRLQYPPRGSQQPDGFFLSRNDGETEAEFEARRSKAFLCDLDRDFIELEKRKPNTLAYRLYKEVRNAPEETGQSFLSSANVKTFFFNMEHLRNLTCCDNIHLETLGDEKTALFIIISATNSTYNFLAAMMYTQLFDTLANRANFKFGGVLPVHVRCIMDEFANIGQIPDFDKVIAFVRSMGMSLNVIIQNIAQLKARYEKTWEVITGNCDTTIFLGGKEESTLKSISEQLGKETIDVKGQNRTKGRQSSTSENNSIIGRELMMPNELSTMPISDCIGMLRGHNPMYCHKYPIEKHPNYKFLADKDPSRKFDISKVHAVSVEEFEKEQQEQKANRKQSMQHTETGAPITDTAEKPVETDAEKVFFAAEQSSVVSADVLVTPSSYEEAAAALADADFDDVYGEEKYTDDQRYGEPSPWEEVDLGDPIPKAKEDDEDEESEVAPAVTVSTSDIDVFFGEVDPTPETISELTPDQISSADAATQEHQPDIYGNELVDPADFHLEPDGETIGDIM